MGKYSFYAKELDKAMREAIAKHRALGCALEAAQLRAEQAQRARNAVHADIDGHLDAELLRAKGDLLEKEQAYKTKTVELWRKFDENAKELGNRLQIAVKRDNMANPEQVDEKMLALMNSGILTLDDMERAADTYSDNVTMQRLCRQYIMKMPANSTAERQRQIAAAEMFPEKNDMGQRWDSLVYTARVFSGRGGLRGIDQPQPFGFAQTMFDKWENDPLATEQLENF